MSTQKKLAAPAALQTWAAEHMPFLTGSENRETFFSRVNMHFPPRDPRSKLILKAYNDAKDAFRREVRSGGERYFEHLRAVTLILLEYLEVTDYTLIVSAILHDIVEDTPEWTIDRAQREYGEEVALLLEYLTEPSVEEAGSKEEAEKIYHTRFDSAPRKFFLIKIPDRLHNLLTLGARPKAKQIAKIEETEEFYIPYARHHQILLPELRYAVRVWKEAHKE